MKKLLFVMVAVLCCLALAGPAMAKITMYGMITMDAYYTSDSEEWNAAHNTAPVLNNAATAFDSVEYTQLNVNRALNRLGMRYESEDKRILGVIELRTGAQNSRTGLDAYYSWLDYRPRGEDLHFRFGLQPETFSIMAPGAASLGYDTTGTLLVGYGNVHASAITAAKLYTRFSDMIRLEFAVGDPATGNDAFTAGATYQTVFPLTAAPGGAAVQQNSTIPRFDIALPITIGKFTIEPSATWLEETYDHVAAGRDDSFDIWGTAVGASIGFGPFKVSGEVTYGQNLGNGNYTAAGNKPPISTMGALGTAVTAVARPLANGTISDTDYLGGWVQLEFDFGPAAIQLAVGAEKVENDSIGTAPAGLPAAIAGDTGEILDTTRMGASFRVPIKVTKEFTIAPQIQYLDNDDGATIYGNNNVDLGNEWIVGSQFIIVF